VDKSSQFKIDSLLCYFGDLIGADGGAEEAPSARVRCACMRKVQGSGSSDNIKGISCLVGFYRHSKSPHSSSLLFSNLISSYVNIFCHSHFIL